MIRSISFMEGRGPGQVALTTKLSAVTVIVGPNNSGKSLALREIDNIISKSPGRRAVIADLEFEPWTAAELDEFVVRYSDGIVSHGQAVLRGANLSGPFEVSIHLGEARKEIEREGFGERHQMSTVFRLLTARLDGKARLELTDDAIDKDFQVSATSPHGVLFRDAALRRLLRNLIFRAFNRYLVVDPTSPGTLRYRLSDQPPADEAEEQGWDERSRNFHSKGVLVATKDSSDGVKAYIGMLTALLAWRPRVALIDEPEAFLHPSLSHQLAKDLCINLAGAGTRLVVATHSANFLMGCIASAAPVNIIRLTYSNGVGTARLLDQARLTPMLRNPLLRSVNMLGALFHNAVVVTEADSDRAFYQEINERLLACDDARGVEGCVFMNAQNKQTVWSIVGPLRDLGIPAAGIVDVDVLKEGGAVWAKIMVGANIPIVTRAALETIRAKLIAIFKALPGYTDKTMGRNGGIDLLEPDDRQAAEELFDTLATYGVFVVRRGELESWLKYVGLESPKERWLSDIFEAMGDDPSLPGYVKPIGGDVWDFVGSVRGWCQNSARRGMAPVVPD